MFNMNRMREALRLLYIQDDAGGKNPKQNVDIQGVIRHKQAFRIADQSIGVLIDDGICILQTAVSSVRPTEGSVLPLSQPGSTGSAIQD